MTDALQQMAAASSEDRLSLDYLECVREAEVRDALAWLVTYACAASTEQAQTECQSWGDLIGTELDRLTSIEDAVSDVMRGGRRSIPRKAWRALAAAVGAT